MLVVAFLTELSIMVLLEWLPFERPPVFDVLIDSCLLVLVLGPFVWWKISRPKLEQLRREREKGYFLTSRMDEGVIAFDRDLSVLSMNEGARRLLGVESEQGRRLTQWFPFRSIDELEARLGSEGAFRVTLDDGRVLSCVSGRLVRSDTYLLIFRDVTEEVALQRWHSLVVAALQAASDSLLITEADGRVVWVNRAFTELTGYEAAEVIGKTPAILKSGKTKPEVYRALWSTILAGQVWSGEVINRRKDGSEYVAGLTIAPVEAEGGERYFIGIHKDITERKRMVSDMMKLDRLAQAGVLAVGVGHEINNPLTYVTMNVNYALDRLPELRAKVDDLGHTLAGLEAGAGGGRAASAAAEVREALAEVEEALGEAQEGCYRVRDIVRDLKLFSRGSEDVRRRLDVHRVLGPAIDMAYNEVRHRARLVKELGEVRPVVGNESRLGQVFLNLLVNAAHAIPMGKAQENEIRIRTGMRGEKVEIEIRDTGEGISESVLPSIFDPFFTTKPVGHGTGLGLSICRQIVEAHGGEIEVESQPGEGSAFRVLLPASDEALPEPEEAPERAPEAAEPKRRVLVIDDEVGIVKGLQRVLGGAYEVTGVTSAGEAIERLEGGAAYDLILCDLMMPDLTGMDFYRWLETKHPDLCARVVFTTGGAFTPEARAFLRSVPNPTLDKPLEPKVLVEAIRTLFSGAEEGDGSASD